MLGAGVPIHSAQVLPTFRTSANKVPVSTKIILSIGDFHTTYNFLKLHLIVCIFLLHMITYQKFKNYFSVAAESELYISTQNFV